MQFQKKRGILLLGVWLVVTGAVEITAMNFNLIGIIVAVLAIVAGVSAEHLPRIFEMFSQVEPALERSQGGLGIGLALVRGLVELHGGTVEAPSSPWPPC